MNSGCGKHNDHFQKAHELHVFSVVISCVWVVLCLGMTGCTTPPLGGYPQPVYSQPIEVFVQSDPVRYSSGKLGIFPFAAPPYALGAGPEVGAVYFQELVRNGVFAQTRYLQETAQTSEAAIWKGRQSGCDLVMISDILYLLDGSGAQSTHLELSTQILDVRSGKPILYLQQNAYSEPGQDIDGYWSTVAGEPAQGYKMLARVLAEQLVAFLVRSKQEALRHHTQSPVQAIVPAQEIKRD